MMILATLLALAPPPVSTTPPTLQHPRDTDTEPALALTWTGPPEACPTRAQILERVAPLSPGSTVGPAPAGLLVDAKVTRSKLDPSLPWQVELTLEDADGRAVRRFTAPSCEAIADATALIIAVTLDPVATAVATSVATSGQTRPPAREAAPEPSQPAPPATPESDFPHSPHDFAPDGDPDPDPAFRRSAPSWRLRGEGTSGPLELRPLRIGVSIQAGGGWGPSAAGHPVLGGRLALLGPHWRAELGGRWALPRGSRAEPPSDARASVDAWFVEARGCWVPSRGAFEFPLCPGVDVGRVRGAGRPPTPNPSEATYPWVALSLGQRAAWVPLERLALVLEAELSVPLIRGSFLAGETELARLAALGARVQLGFELRLP